MTVPSLVVLLYESNVLEQMGALGERGCNAKSSRMANNLVWQSCRVEFKQQIPWEKYWEKQAERGPGATGTVEGGEAEGAGKKQVDWHVQYNTPHDFNVLVVESHDVAKIKYLRGCKRTIFPTTGANNYATLLHSTSVFPVRNVDTLRLVKVLFTGDSEWTSN